MVRGAPRLKFDIYNPVQLSFSRDSGLIALIDKGSMETVIWDLSRDEKISMNGAENYP